MPNTSNTGGVSLAEIREQEFPIVKELTYLNSAAVGPVPTRTRRAVEETVALEQFPSTPRARAIPSPESEAKTRLARLIGARAGDIVFTSSTTHGINICARGIDWRPGDNVVVPRDDFPSLSFAWNQLHLQGVEVRFVPWTGAGPAVDDIMSAVDARTRAVSCSLIKWDTGHRVDLETLGRRCAEQGCLLIVDGIQAVGAERLDVRAARISALATHAYKWLLGGFGLGALYVAPEALDQIRSVFVSGSSFVSDGNSFKANAEPQPGAERYALSNSNRVGQTALVSSLGLIEEIGINTIEEQRASLAETLWSELQRRGDSVRLVSPADAARRSAIIVFTTGSRERDTAFVQKLEDMGIIVALRPLGVRVSPNFYNTEAEIGRLVDALPK
jgi:cysteine desulfurase / selenocysteine lyase